MKALLFKIKPPDPSPMKLRVPHYVVIANPSEASGAAIHFLILNFNPWIASLCSQRQHIKSNNQSNNFFAITPVLADTKHAVSTDYYPKGLDDQNHLLHHALSLFSPSHA
jgi:hypothetical protein